MKDKLIIILLVIITGLIVYLSFIKKSDTSKYDSYYQKIDSLQNKIDSAMVVNQLLDNKLVQIDSNITVINNQILVVDENINHIKETTDENVASVDTFSHSQLEQFFTNRYK